MANLNPKHPIEVYVQYFEDGLPDHLIASKLNVSERTVRVKKSAWKRSKAAPSGELFTVEVVEAKDVNGENILNRYQHLSPNAQMDWLLAQESLKEALKANNGILAEIIKKDVLEAAKHMDIAKNYGKLTKHELDFFKTIIHGAS